MTHNCQSYVFIIGDFEHVHKIVPVVKLVLSTEIPILSHAVTHSGSFLLAFQPGVVKYNLGPPFELIG